MILPDKYVLALFHGNHTEFNMPNNLQNLIYGGSFEKSTHPSGSFSNIGTPTAVVRDTGDRDGYGGIYSVKITSNGSGNEGIKATFSNLKASTKYTVRVRAKATAGDTAKIWTTGGGTNLDEETTSTSWVDLIGFFVTDATPADIVLNIGSDNATDIVWFDMLMVVEGQGAFTWTPYPGEIIKVAVDRVTSNTTLTQAHSNVFCDGTITITLPPGIEGIPYRIVNTGTEIVTITPDGSENLLGENSSFMLNPREALIIVYESTEGWY